MSVFITSARSRAVLSAIRSIGKQGVSVYAGEVYKNAVGFYSKYCKGSFIYPSPEKEQIFVESLYFLIEKTKSDVLLPGHDDTMYLISKYKDKFENMTIVPVPNFEVLKKAFDKYETMVSARRECIQTPETYYTQNENDLKKLSKEVEYPLVVKPRFQKKGYGAYGIAYVNSPDELIRAYINVNKEFGDCLIQELIPGDSEQMHMVNTLFDEKSNPVAVFTAKKYRTHPITGGSTTLGESTWNPELAELGVKLLRRWKWYGLAELEFKIDPRDGKPKLIEVNPRFWAYIDLPIASGVDFPYLLYKIAIGENVEPIKKYKVGIKFINPIADVLVAFQVLKQSKKRVKTLRDLLIKCKGEKTFGLFSPDDPIPFLCEIFWNLSTFRPGRLRTRI